MPEVTTGYVEVPLTQGQVALVDEADAEAVMAHKWYAQRIDHVWYAQRSFKTADGKWRKERLHTFLTGHSLTDHVSGDGLDNRRANLRPATKAENARNRPAQSNNTSGYKGVGWDATRGKWRAQIKAPGTPRYLGRFGSAEDAARAYDAAARQAFGAFAWLNFPGDG
jgi:hypothetical protein